MAMSLLLTAGLLLASLATASVVDLPQSARQTAAPSLSPTVDSSELGELVPGISFPDGVQIARQCSDALEQCRTITDPADCRMGVFSQECCTLFGCYDSVASNCDTALRSLWVDGLREQVSDFVECVPATPTPAPTTAAATPSAAATETPGSTATAEPTSSSAPTPTETDGPTASPEPRNPPSPLPTIAPAGNVTMACSDAINKCIGDAMTTTECANFTESITECCDAFTSAEDCITKTFDSGAVCEGLDDEPVLKERKEAAAEAKEEACEKDDDSVCFPGDALVALDTGAVRRMDQLEIGDRVLSRDGVFSEVFFFSHRETRRAYRFVELSLSNKQTIALTASHYLKVNGALAPARTVRAGDHVYLQDGAPVRVECVSSVAKIGLYNPHTLTGELVVDGVQTSAYTTSVHPVLAHALLAPLRALYDAGVVAPGLLDNDATWLASVMPRGSSTA